MPANHCKPHTEEAKAKMRATRALRPNRWGHLPGEEIARRLLDSDATTRSIAREFRCSDSTIKGIFKRHSTKEERISAKNRKAADSKRGIPNPRLGEWRKTHDVWTGRKHRSSSREKQSARKKGRRFTLTHRISMSARRQGIDKSEWKGFASDKTQLLKKSPEYKEWRSAVFTRDNWECQECHVRGGALHAHHIKAKSIYPELVFEVNNGVTLCAACHRKTDTYGLNLVRAKVRVS